MPFSKIKSFLSQSITSLTTSKPEMILEALIRSSFINFLARIFGYLKFFFIATLLGLGLETDAFFMALSLIGIFIMFADVFDSIGVPNLVQARQRSEEDFKKLAGLLFTFTMILTLFITIASIILLPVVLKIPKGFSPEAIDLTKVSYMLLIPYVSLNFIFHHFGAVLRSVRRFTHYFIGELISTFVSSILIAVGLLIYGDWKVIPISISVAQVVATLYMVYKGREFLHFSFYIDKTTKEILKTFGYLSALYGVFHLYILTDKAFASILEEKSVSALTYGFLIANIPRGIIKLEHMAITSLSEVKGSLEKLNFYIKKILILTIPLSMFVFFTSDVLVKILFGYKSFSSLDVDITATATRYYVLSLPFMFIWPILYRTFQIRQDLKPIFFISILGVIVNFVLNYILVLYLNLGLVGICLGTFGAYALICVSGYIILRR